MVRSFLPRIGIQLKIDNSKVTFVGRVYTPLSISIGNSFLMRTVPVESIFNGLFRILKLNGPHRTNLYVFIAGAVARKGGGQL